MNTKNQLELAYQRVVDELVVVTGVENINLTRTLELLKALDKIQYLIESWEDLNDLSDLMCKVPAISSKSA